MEPQKRYERDPLFRRLVDTLEVQIRDAVYTPTEIREAAMLAQIHYEQTNIRRRIFYRDEQLRALGLLSDQDTTGGTDLALLPERDSR